MSFLLKLDKMLAGAPNHVLTALLLGMAAVGALIAWRGTPALKAFTAAWFLLP